MFKALFMCCGKWFFFLKQMRIDSGKNQSQTQWAKKNNKSDVIVVVAASYLLLIFGDVNFVIHRSKRALIWFNVITCRHFSNHIHLRSFISITLAILNEKLIWPSDNLPLNSLTKYETVLIATIIKS